MNCDGVVGGFGLCCVGARCQGRVVCCCLDLKVIKVVESNKGIIG